ncbi:MAG: DUF4317 family protein, partial [Lachnospiraceae bacterium]|nr:DUF4317 family protein [Lachnospiraceae bacterium]
AMSSSVTDLLGTLRVPSSVSCAPGQANESHAPMSSEAQKDVFAAVIEETIGSSCDLELMKSIHDHLSQMDTECSEQDEILTFNKEELKQLLIDSGADDGLFEMYDATYETYADPKDRVYASNVMHKRSFDVKTPSVVIKVDPGRTDLIEKREIDGRQCLVIALDGDVEVNGVMISRT